jgi:glycosyltransferase involved in cell wall biosynthesis
MDPAIPVPPTYYGGIERVISTIANKYVEMGHEVTLIAGPNSKSPGRLIVYGQNSEVQSIRINYSLLNTVWRILHKEIGKHDVIHNFGRLLWLYPIAWSPIRKVQTYMRYITPSNIRWLNRLGVRNITYTAVSDAIVKTGKPGGGDWRTVYNCAPVKVFTFNPDVDTATAPLVFLGRLERCKGLHTAIKAAKLANRQLIIAGNISALPEEKQYFEKEIRPSIDGEQIKYIGPVHNRQKNDLLGRAAAMLLPVEWYEPFPVVLPEAFACGTPILAFPRGGVPEGIREGVTGFLSHSAEEMAKQIYSINMLNRAACRSEALEKYSDQVIAEDYIKIYSQQSAGISVNVDKKYPASDPVSHLKPKKIVIITSGQPSTNPRMVKEYLALKQRGYQVKVLYAFCVQWALEADEKSFDKELHRADFKLVDGSPVYRRTFYNYSRLLNRINRTIASALPFFIRQWTLTRPGLFLYREALRQPADIYIAHNLAALPAAVLAAKKFDAQAVFDAEDYHRGEWINRSGQQYKTAVLIEDQYISRCNRITAASPLIAEAYKKLYPSISVSVINNVFSKNFLQPFTSSGRTEMTMFWFSQTVGPDRGLETVVKAIEILKDTCNIELHLMGNVSEQYKKDILQRITKKEIIRFIEPVAPDIVFSAAAKFDIGLAPEISYTENRNYCLTNKLFTYLLAGNCIVASDTDAQVGFFKKYPGAGFVYESENAEALSRLFLHLYNNRDQLNQIRHHNHNLAATDLNWENEQQYLLNIVESIVQ